MSLYVLLETLLPPNRKTAVPLATYGVRVSLNLIFVQWFVLPLGELLTG